MDTSNFRPELHVAQQSRRDKLRIQHDSSNTQPHYHNFSVYAHSLDQLHAQEGLNYSNIRACRQVGNICDDPSELSSEMLSFSASSQGMLSNQEPDKQVVGLDCSYDESHFSRTFPNNPNSATVVSSDPQYFSSTWKSIGSQSISGDWLANQGPIFVGEGLSGSHHQLKIMNNNITDVKPNYQGYHQELHEAPSNPYQNALQELVTSSSVRSLGLEFASLRQKDSEESSHGGPNWFQWSGELDYAAVRNNNNNRNYNSDKGLRVSDSFSNTQALSLSLSSVPSPKVHATQIAAEKDSNGTDLTDIHEHGKMMGNQALVCRNPGPLGPFTGYATILRSSKFLRPAQQLMDELCCTARPENGEVREVNDKNLGEVIRVCDQGVSNGDFGVKGVESDVSGGSSFAFSGSCDKSRETGGASYSTDSYRPQNLQKKAKLVFMQDEVCKKYKQYQQQMQMVVSSFESVSGLSAATPYVSLVLKMVSKHFRCLKNAIIDQIKSIRNALGEDLSSSNNSRGEGSVSMLKVFDQSFQKQKGGGAGLGILEGHHIWRPQRGLPEHAVSILRAWLFDHFLHPYPTDTDKHMLAAQTGLTRNQVSNWFINARVRVWKPMVEEIHMLETKGVANPEGETNNGKTALETCNGSDHDSNNTQPLKKPVECPTISPSSEQDFERLNPNMWNQEKRSRVEYHGQLGVNQSLMGWVPPHRGGNELGPTGAGLGAVSLTLGLMQSVENAQQEQHHHLRTRFGGQVIRDFVG